MPVLRRPPTHPNEHTTFGPEERGFVYAVARRIVGNPEDAEDVAQDALTLAYRHRHAFRGDARYRTWLYRIASTTALGHLRRRRRSREYLAATDEPVGHGFPDGASSPEDRVSDAEEARAVEEALAGLDPKYRDVVLARIDATESETAAQLGISVANVKIRAHRARRQLQSVLAEAR